MPASPGPDRRARAVAAPRRARRRAQPRWRDAQSWRLASGLILFVFALTHFLNHALGHVSVETMEAVQEVRRGFWRSWPGTLLLYGALAIHVGLGIGKLVRRRTLRLAWWEGAQIALGLSIPFLAVAHVTATRGLNALYGYDDAYSVVLSLLWPGLAWSQSLLLAVVWLHAMIGLHAWLRVKGWYRAWSPLFLALAVMVPVLALTGWIEAARRLALAGARPPIPAYVLEAGGPLIGSAKMYVWTAFWIIAALLVSLRMIDWFRRGPPVTYPGGQVARAAPGATLLEISRAAGLPHAAVCGGRGRCTTCRVMVTEGEAQLPPPNPTETAALARVGAPPGVRLACQIRPAHPVTVHPLVSVGRAPPVLGRGDDRWGVERRITVLFADLRGFTTLAERLYPYDAVFLLNRYFETMGHAVERHAGHVDKFLGDGIMALFGVAPARGAGARDAVLAADEMFRALDRLNEEFGAALSERLRMGVGIHTGPAILGQVGAQRSSGLTALGDTVNIASRLESLNKEFASVLVVSEATLRGSGLVLSGTQIHHVGVRGREETLTVHVVKDAVVVEETAPALAG